MHQLIRDIKCDFFETTFFVSGYGNNLVRDGGEDKLAVGLVC